MSWTNLIGGTAGIIDSYNSHREVGSSSTQPGTKSRTHNTTGIYGEIGIVVLEYLNRKNDEVAKAYVQVEQIYNDNQETLHKIDKKIALNDVRYVVNLFADSIPIKFKSQSIKNTYQTALIEKARVGGDVRISELGQYICRMSGVVVNDMLNIDLEVQKLSRDLEYGRFINFIKQCENCIKMTQISTREIYLYCEKPTPSKRKDEFLKNKDRYLDTINKTTRNFIALNDLFNASHIKEKINTWNETTHGDYDIEFRIQSQVKELQESLEKFSRAILHFIDWVNKRKPCYPNR